MQVNIDSGKILTGLLLAALTGGFVFIWGMNERVIRLEASQNLSDRVEKLENALLPVLIEFRLIQEIEKLELKSIEEDEPIVGPIFEAQPKLDDPDFRRRTKNSLRKGAENWAKEQMQKEQKDQSLP